MPTTEPRALTEPPDGTVYVVQDAPDHYRVIVRDDENGYKEARWFDNPSEEPMTWHQHVEDAIAVYAVSPDPMTEPVYPEPGSTIPGQEGYVVGTCQHRVARSEWRAGFRTCERDLDPEED